MSLSHFFSITQTWRIAISWLDTPGRILSSTWYHRWLQPVIAVRQDAQKPVQKFCARKTARKRKRTRFSQKKAKPGAFWVLERKTAVKASCGQMRGGNTGCNIRRELVDRVRTSIGTKKPQAMRFSRGLGTSGLAGAEGLEPSARGFGVDVRTAHKEQGRAGVVRFFSQERKRVVLIWCCGKTFRGKAVFKSPLLEGLPPRDRIHITYRGLNRHRRLGRGFPLYPRRPYR